MAYSYDGVDLRKHPEQYRIGRGEQDVFHAEPSGLWSAVLRRQPGSLAWVSTRPADPTLN